MYYKKILKKLIVILITVSIVMSVMPLPQVKAAQEGDFTYTIIDSAAEITGYTGSGGNIIIPDTLGGYPVTSIGDRAFYNCISLTSIYIPSSVMKIGTYAFYSCTNLTTLSIPNNVSDLGDYVFQSCANLINITIPNSIIKIGRGVFSNTPWLENQIDTFVIIGDHILIDYNGTNDIVNIPYGIKTIVDAFYNNITITNVNIPESVTSIGANAFYECSNLISISLPNSLTYLGDRAFYKCSSLKNINIPNNLININNATFEYCTSLSNIVIPSNVTRIGEYAFCDCTSLISITLPENMISIGSYAFYECKKLTSIILPNGINTIGTSMFTNCYNLANITIPNTVTSIGDWTFWNCYNLKDINLPNNITTIGRAAFYNCQSLNSIMIPNNISDISTTTFAYCSGLTSIILPTTVKNIESSAFDHCTNLTSIFIPATVSSIQTDAFLYCSNIIIYCPANSYAQTYAMANNIPYINASSPLANISMATQPSKTVYNYGESLSLDGASITVNFEDLSTSTINITNEMVSGYNPNEVGIQTITVSYGGKTTSFEVTVNNDIVSISMQSSPAKINYNYGEAINLNGAQIKVTYANTDTETIAVTSDMISGYNPNQLGAQTVTVTYGDKTTSFNVTVNNTVASISMISSPTKTDYTLGESIDLTGAEILVTYADTTTTTIPITADMLSGYDPNKIGTQTVTVTYEGKTTIFEVTVKLNTYNVSFNSQGGSSVAGTTAVDGTKLTAPAMPTKSGYTFGGWYKETGCTNAWNFDRDTVTETMTLYAKWNNITPGVSYCGHVQNIGWMAPVADGAMCGTSGMSYRVEALKINLQNAPAGLTIKYRVHVQNIGWMGWVSNGAMAGTSGQSLRVEAIQIILEGTDADKYSVQYQTHVQNIGWQGWVSDGAVAGTSGQSLRVEAIRIKIVEKAPVTPPVVPPVEPPVVPPVVPSTSSVVYQGHVQNIGWQAPVADGALCGTSGMSYRVEAFNIHLENVPAGMSVKYKVHVQNIGWMDWVRNGANAGTTGQSLRVEAIQIMLEGTDADKYSIRYQAHVQNIGWQPWVSDGAVAGTSGQSLRVEAIRIQLVKK